MAVGFQLNTNPLDSWLTALQKHHSAKIEALAQSGAAQLAGYARKNAPWRDQSGHARASIQAHAAPIGQGFGITLWGDVEYFSYLERKKPILAPTLARLGPGILHNFQGG